jgi:sec-independent protein translocase protein TatA
MFGIGHWWIIVIAVPLLVLIVFGPGKLGDLGGAVSRTIREFRKASAGETEERREQAASRRDH